MKLKPLPALPLLDPAVLDRSADEAARALMREGSSANTAASYRAAMRYWAAWFELRYGRRFAPPLPETAVVQFVVDHARRQTEQGLTSEMPAALDQELVRLKVKGRLGPPGLNTVLQRVSVLSKAHDTLGLPNPCRAQAARSARSHPPRACPARRGARAQAGPDARAAAGAVGYLRRFAARTARPGATVRLGQRRSAPPEVVRATIENTPRGEDGFLYLLRHPRPTRRAPPGPRTPSRSWERRRGPCRPGWMPAASRKARCSAGSGAAMCWASHWPPPPCAISCASAASWRAWTKAIPRTACARASSPRPVASKCHWAMPWP